MNTLIQAIHKKQTVLILYKGLPRIVEPHIYGRSPKGIAYVRCFQTAGETCSEILGWRIFEVGKIQVMAPIPNQHFSKARLGYVIEDPVIKDVYARL